MSIDWQNMSFKEFISSLFIIRLLFWVIKNLWPLIVIWLFLPEIDAIFGTFKWWNAISGSTMNYLRTSSEFMRKIPLFGDLLAVLDKWAAEVRQRLLLALH